MSAPPIGSGETPHPASVTRPVRSSRLADAEAVRALAARDPALPALGALLDPDRLADAVGETVRVTRVRYKPGASVVLAVDDGGEHRWITTHADAAKAEKTRTRAQRAGYEIDPVPGIAGALAGPVFADRELASVVRGLRRMRPELVEGAQVLRHNPHRRLVLRAGEKVVKIAAETRGEAGRIAAVTALAGAGVPVLVPDSAGPGVTTTTWWGRGDLAGRREPRAAAAAGAALARLHRVGSVRPPAGLVARELTTAVRAVTVLAPAAGERAAALALAALPVADADEVVLHGDFTADQVLVDGAEVRLIDFDRLTSGAPERDLGSFVAGERLRQRAGERGDADDLAETLLDAYRAAGGSVDERALRRWTGVSVLLRAAEPFRQWVPGWRDGIDAALDVAEEALR